MSGDNSQKEKSLEDSLLDLLGTNKSGMTTAKIQAQIPFISIAELVKALNNLIASEKISLFKQKNELLYKLTEATKSKLKGTDAEEKILFQIIENTGSKGITEREVGISSNMSKSLVKRVLKAMETKKIIKSFKANEGPKKNVKVFILYDIDPDQSVTGGIWYDGEDYETEFIEALNQQCYRFLLQAKVEAEKFADPLSRRNGSTRSSKDICNYVNGLKISKVQLNVKHIETILETLIYDGKIEKSAMFHEINSGQQGIENFYRVVNPLVKSSAIMRMPCGVCLVFNNCYEGGAVSPTNCQYMKEWLEF